MKRALETGMTTKEEFSTWLSNVRNSELLVQLVEYGLPKCCAEAYRIQLNKKGAKAALVQLVTEHWTVAIKAVNADPLLNLIALPAATVETFFFQSNRFDEKQLQAWYVLCYS